MTSHCCFLSFLLVCPQAGGGFLAYKRFQAGADAAFSQGLADDEGFGTAATDAAGYQAGYTGEEGGEYGEPPFGGAGQSAGEKKKKQAVSKKEKYSRKSELSLKGQTIDLVCNYA